MKRLLAWDLELLNFINHTLSQPWNDKLMRLWSAEWPWYVLLTYFLLQTLWGRRWRNLASFCWIGATLGVSDMLAAYIIKPWVGRLRPCRLEGLVHLVDGCGGSFGFPSNHASNAAVFAVMWLLLRSRRQGLIAICCGLMVGFSRVYLGVHYPSDIFAGFLCGTCIGLLSVGLWKLAHLTVFRSYAATRL